MALAGPGLRAQNVGQEGLRGAIAVEDIVLAAFLEIHHELDGNARVARPFGIGRVAPVAAEIARIGRRGHVYISSKRIFCAPCHSTVLPNAVRFSSPEVRVMK